MNARYWTWMLVWVVGSFLILDGCNTVLPDSNRARSMEIAMAEENENFSELSMAADARIEGEKLVVEYTVRNKTDQNIYLFDQMVAYDGNVPVVDQDTAYCFFEEPNTLRLVRATLRLPLEKEVRVQEIPFARAVPPRGEVTGKIQLKLPVVEKSAFYAPPKEETSKEVECRRVRLLVGWTRPHEGMTIAEVEAGGVKALRIRGAWPPPYQRFLEQKFDLPVKVLVHTDVFDRQMPLQ